MIRSRLPAAALAAILVGYPLLTVAPAAARGETVAFNGGYSAGTIVVRTGQRALYLVLDSGHALRYTVGVGRAGKQWSGTSYISGKYLQPGVDAAGGSAQRQTVPAGGHSWRLTA